MTESMTQSAIQVWVGLAWCDVSLSLEEELALRQLFDSSTALSEQERRFANAQLSTPGGKEYSDRALKDVQRLSGCPVAVRADVYHAALLLALVDQPKFSEREQQYLRQLRDALKLSSAELRRLGISDLIAA